MKLTVHDSLTFPPTAGSSLEIDHGLLAGSPAFKAETTVSAGYTDITSVAHWDAYGWGTGLDYRGVRNELIRFVGSWATLTTDEKKILVRYFVCPAGTTESELDGYWTAAERTVQRQGVRKELEACDCLIMASKTAGSEKVFMVEVDDTGTLASTEIVSDAVL